MSAHLKAHSIAQEAKVVVGIGEQTEVLALLHSEQRLLRVEFQSIGLFLEAGPGVVAAPLDLHWQRSLGRAY